MKQQSYKLTFFLWKETQTHKTHPTNSVDGSTDSPVFHAGDSSFVMIIGHYWVADIIVYYLVFGYSETDYESDYLRVR